MAKTIYVDNSIIPQDKKFTFVTDDVVAGATTLGVQSTLGFVSLTTASGQVLMIGELGQERTEIIKTSSTTAPGGTSVTLNSALRFSHPQDTKVYIVDWDRFEVQHSTTATGTKTTLMAYPEVLQPDQMESIYRDTTKSAGFYFIRFNNSTNSTNSDWSDPVPYAGFDDNSVFSIKQRALESINEIVDGKVISDEFLNRALWELRREYHNMPGKRPFRKKFNVDIGNVLTGSFFIELPDDVEAPFTAENVYGVRVGTEDNMSYIDKKEWDFYYVDKPHSTLALPYTVNVSTSIWLANGRDFSGSATIQVEGTEIACTRIVGEQNSFYVRTHGDWSASGGSDAWENITLGLPDEFTVWQNVSGGSAKIYFNIPFETAYINQNIYADYYRKVVELQTDYDSLDEPEYDMFVYGLAWKIKKRKNPELQLLKDSDYLMWLQLKNSSHANEFEGNVVSLSPDIDHLM